MHWRDPYQATRGSYVPTRTWRNADGRCCREYQQTIVIGGREERAFGTACRQPDGSWRMGNEQGSLR